MFATRALVSLALGGALALTPALAHADSGDHVTSLSFDDDGMSRPSVARTEVAAGALAFGGAYGASVITAATGGGSSRLYIPVIGPVLQLFDHHQCDVAHPCDHETATKVLLVADSVFQAAGLVSMVDGLITFGRDKGDHNPDHGYKLMPATFGAVHGDGAGLTLGGKF